MPTTTDQTLGTGAGLYPAASGETTSPLTPPTPPTPPVSPAQPLSQVAAQPTAPAGISAPVRPAVSQPAPVVNSLNRPLPQSPVAAAPTPPLPTSPIAQPSPSSLGAAVPARPMTPAAVSPASPSVNQPVPAAPQPVRPVAATPVAPSAMPPVAPATGGVGLPVLGQTPAAVSPSPAGMSPAPAPTPVLTQVPSTNPSLATALGKATPPPVAAADQATAGTVKKTATTKKTWLITGGIVAVIVVIVVVAALVILGIGRTPVDEVTGSPVEPPQSETEPVVGEVLPEVCLPATTDAFGQQATVEAFLATLESDFVDEPITDEYQELMAYYVDRTVYAVGDCKDHSQYCYHHLANGVPFLIQFAHFDQARGQELTWSEEQWTARYPADELRDIIAYNFGIEQPDFTLDTSSVDNPEHPLNYQASDDTFQAYGHYDFQQDYFYTLSAVKRQPTTGQIVLIGESGAVAGQCFDDAAGQCPCQASRLYLVMENGPYGDLMYTDQYLVPVSGQVASI